MATLTYKENVLRVLRHKEPEYMPFPSDLDFCFPTPIREVGKSVGGKPGLDWFGQSWTFEPTIGGYNPTPNVHLITDITRWREQMKFPDLDAIDWEAAAAKDTANWDRENKLSRARVCVLFSARLRAGGRKQFLRLRKKPCGIRPEPAEGCDHHDRRRENCRPPDLCLPVLRRHCLRQLRKDRASRERREPALHSFTSRRPRTRRAAEPEETACTA